MSDGRAEQARAMVQSGNGTGSASETEPVTTPAPEESEPVLYEARGAIAWLTLNRPHRLNAVSQRLYEALLEAIVAAERADEVRVLVLTGAGRAFCAGADLKGHAESDRTLKHRRRYAQTAQAANLALQRCAKPVVAAVNGHAIGAGLEMALSCDFMIVAAEAKLRFPEVALGTFVGGGVTYTLQERVGSARARELLLLADFFSGADAVDMGVANRSVPAAQLEAVSTALAERLAAQAPVSIALMRRLLRRARRASRRAMMAAETRALVHCMGTEDWKEGVTAFSEDRLPRYTGQ
ncbi:MAG: enoyl-CoA hydratase/isomerase family protein [Gemmatimonadetes bacterium]|nr:enoyl-CoA hydratase/isomerase family protein [Gemmatimonadota bacterium]